MLLQTVTQALVQVATPPPTPPPVDRPGFFDTLMASFRDAFSMILSAIPRIIGFIIIVAIGWFISSLLAKGVTGLWGDPVRRVDAQGRISDS